MPKKILGEKFTFVLLNGLGSRVLKINFSKRIMRAGIFILLAGICGFGYLSYRTLNTNIDKTELAALKRLSLQQKQDIRKFAYRLEEFQKQMARLEKFDKKLRIITAMDSSVTDSHDNFGVGGPIPDTALAMDGIKSGYTESLLIKLNEDLDHLSYEASQRELSFHSLDAFFKDQSSLLTSTPSVWPARGWVTSGFGYRLSPFTGLRELHEGVDIATHLNADVIATANGVVIDSSRKGGYGNVIEIDHGYGIVTRYGHNSLNLVKRGDRVKRGQIIAKVGSTGRSTGPHLHYEVLLNGIPVNPLRYILTN